MNRSADELAAARSPEALQARLDAAESKLARVVLERDAWAQELFESNRFAAELVVARQTLADEVARLQAERDRAVEELATTRNSTSWRITNPIRAVLRALGRRRGAGA